MALIGSIDISAGLITTGLVQGAKTAVDHLGKIESAAGKLDNRLSRLPGQIGGELAKLGSAAGKLYNNLSGIPGKIGNGLTAVADRYHLVAGAAVAAAGAAGMGAWIKSSMDGINETRGLADRLGVTSESLSKLQYAAKLADVDSSTLAGSLEKLNVRLAEVAQEGKGPAADALKRFGLNASELAQQGPVEAFHQIAAVLEKIQNPAARAAAAVDLFGKSGQQMLMLVQQGADGIKELEDEAVKLGVAFTDVDAAKLDEADDALTRVWEGVAGIGNSLAITVAPFITLVSEQIVEFGLQGAQSGSYVSQAFEWVGSAVGVVVDTIDMLGIAWAAVRNTITTGIAWIITGLSKMVQGLDWILQKVAGVSSGIGDFMQAWSEEAHKTSDQQWESFAQKLAGPSLRQSARKLIDDVQASATERARESVAEGKKFKGGAGEQIKPQEKDLKLAGAVELGSKEALKIEAQARGFSAPDDAKKTAANTAASVEIQNRQLVAMNRVAELLAGSGGMVNSLGTL